MEVTNHGRETSTAILGTLLLLITAACSSKDYVEVPIHPASGKLMIAGQPGYGAYITFHPVGDVGMSKGNKPFARVARDGSFQVTTYDTADGAPVGDFKVTIYWPEDPEARGPSPDRLKGRYADPDASELVARIEPGNNTNLQWNIGG